MPLLTLDSESQISTISALVEDEIDIDAVLAAGSKKTKELTDKVDALGGKGEESLLNFKLDSGGIQTFDGVDYSGSSAKDQELERLKMINEVGTLCMPAIHLTHRASFPVVRHWPTWTQTCVHVQ